MLNGIKKSRSLIVLVLIVAFVFAFPTGVSAASEDTVYVVSNCTTTYYYDEGSDETTMVYSYDLDGLLKKSTKMMRNIYDYTNVESVYNYGKNNRLVKRTDKFTFSDWSGSLSRESMIKTDKAGYLVSIKDYDDVNNGSLLLSRKYSYNKKDQLTKTSKYDCDGENVNTCKYTYTKKGKIKKIKGYLPSGKMFFKEVFKYDGNKCTATTTVYYGAKLKDGSKKGKLLRTKVMKYSKDGRLLSLTIYNGKEGKNKIYKQTFKYITVMTDKPGKVKAQQAALAVLSDNLFEENDIEF